MTDFKNRGAKLLDHTIAVFSDIHCGSHQNNPLWHKHTLEWGEWVKKELTKRGINDIVIPGDVFHDRNEVAVNTMHTVCSLFKLWEDFNIIITVGNHDAYYKDNSKVHSLSVLSGWANIHVVDQTEMLDAFGRRMLFVPWGDDDTEKYPEVDIIFGHFEIESFKMNATKICTHGINAKKLLNRADLVISGHFHHRDERNYDNGTVLYLGSPYQLDWGDAHTKRGITILDIKTLKRDFIQNDVSPEHNKIKLSDIIAKRSLEPFQSKIKNNIVKLIVDTSLKQEQVEELVKKMGALKPFSLNTEWLYSDDIKEVNAEIEGVDIEKCIIEFVDAMQTNNKEKVLEKTLEVFKLYTNG